MEDMCVSGKWDGKEQKMIVSNNCMYDCWKCRMQSSFRLLNLGDCNRSAAKDCKCKCGDKKDMNDTCVKGKWDGKEEKIIVSNMCMHGCWKCRMEGSFEHC